MALPISARLVARSVALLGASAASAVLAFTSAPIIRSIEPPAPIAGPDIRAITVRGEDFRPGLAVETQSPDGQRRAQAGADISRVRATSFEVLLALPVGGRYLLIVSNPDGGVSEPFPLDVREAEARPEALVIRSVDPQTLEAGSEPRTIRVEGSGFDRGVSALLTDPIGAAVPDVEIADLRSTSLTLTARFDVRGDYALVLTLPSGRTSNLVQLTVR